MRTRPGHQPDDGDEHQEHSQGAGCDGRGGSPGSASAGSERAEIFVATRDIAEQLVSMGVDGRLVSLDNMVDKAAMKEKLAIALRELGAL